MEDYLKMQIPDECKFEWHSNWGKVLCLEL